jgi:creatinine amidohydrolase
MENQCVAMKITELTGIQFDIEDKRTALIVVGSVERHGDHLPLGTDGIIPKYIVEKVTAELNLLVLPSIWYGSCKSIRNFPGTFDIDPDALLKYVRSVMLEANRNGIKLLVVINGHGGNSVPISMAARDVSSQTDLNIIVLDWWKELGTSVAGTFSAPGHAGENETSAMLAINEKSVNMNHAKMHIAVFPKFRLYSRALDLKLYSIALTGDARKATKEKGEVLLKAVVQDLIKLIKEAQGLIKL